MKKTVYLNNNPEIADKAAFYSVKPKSIRCCASHQKFLEKKEIQPILLDDFLKTKRLKEYTTSTYLTTTQLKSVWLDRTYPKQPILELETELFDPSYTDRFVLVNMGEQLGEGLFLAHDAQPIKAGAPVMIYSGQYCARGDRIKLSDYRFGVDPSLPHEFHSVLINPNALPGIDSENVGNLSRYVQNAPDAFDFENVKDPHHIASKVSVANLNIRVTIYQGFPVLYLQAIRDIQPGEMLSVSYGINYFRLRSISCLVCDDYGRVIGNMDNNVLTPILPVKNIMQLRPATRISDAQLKKLGEILRKPFTNTIGYDFTAQFVLQVSTIFFNGIQMLSEDNIQHQSFLSDIFLAFNEAKTPEETYRVIQQALQHETFKQPSLLFLKRPLIKQCLDFHEQHSKAQVAKAPGQAK